MFLIIKGADGLQIGPKNKRRRSLWKEQKSRLLKAEKTDDLQPEFDTCIWAELE